MGGVSRGKMSTFKRWCAKNTGRYKICKKCGQSFVSRRGEDICLYCKREEILKQDLSDEEINLRIDEARMQEEIERQEKK